MGSVLPFALNPINHVASSITIRSTLLGCTNEICFASRSFWDPTVLNKKISLEFFFKKRIGL